MGLIAVDNFTGTEYYVDAINGSDSTGASEGLTAGNAFQTLYYAIHTGIPFYGADTTNGDRINLLDNSTHNISTAINLSGTRGSGSASAPVIVQGCTSTPGDGGIANLNNAIGGSSIANSGNWNFKFVDLKITSDGAKWSSSNATAEYYNCWIKAENSSGEFIYSNSDRFYNCTIEFENHDFRYNMKLRDCVIIAHSNRSICGWFSSNSLSCFNCLFINDSLTFTQHLVYLTTAINCTAIAVNGDGINGIGIAQMNGVNNHVENVGTAFKQYYVNNGFESIGNTYYNCTNASTTYSASEAYFGMYDTPELSAHSIFSTVSASSVVLDTATNNLDEYTIGSPTAGGLYVIGNKSVGSGIGLPAGSGPSYTNVASAKFTRLE